MVEERSLSVPQAAARLGVTAGRVRQLVASGELTAGRVGRVLLVDTASVDQRAQLGTLDGRRFSPQRAWGLLFLIDGLDTPWLDPVSRAKLRHFIAHHDLAPLRPRLVTRAQRRQFRAHPSDLGPIQREPGLMRTGVSAASDIGLDLMSPDEFDAYLTKQRLDALIDKYKLLEGQQPNLTLRMTPALTPDWPERPSAPASVVAIDLADDLDPRSQEAAQHLLKRYQR
jgi:excisionase family DNA binding protein